jgi:hypothetical protein
MIFLPLPDNNGIREKLKLFISEQFNIYLNLSLPN